MKHSRGLSRRRFIQQGSVAALAASLVPSWASAAAKTWAPIGYTQQPLPYGYNALEPMIDAMTMEIHYTKHAATYTKNLADAVIAEKVDTAAVSLETLFKNMGQYSAKMRNNAGGHYNHELFWASMRPAIKGNAPSGVLLEAIKANFESFEAFKTQFADAAKSRFGSGWAWLVRTPEGKLVVSSTPNQDNPLMSVAEVKGVPLLGLDVWEHAYYLKYQNRRVDYINAWWDIVHWDAVASRL